MKKQKKNGEHGILSNLWFLFKIFMRTSPLLTLGEIILSILSRIPSRLVAVIGVKFIIDEVEKGSTERIIFGLITIAAVMIISQLINSVFYEMYIHREREKLELKIQSMLFKKAAEIDLGAYDDPDFYSDFVLAFENVRNFINRTYWREYIEEIVSLILISGIIVSIDPVILAIILVSSAISVPLCRKTGLLFADKRRDTTEIRRKSDYFFRLFYQPEYAGEIRTSEISPLLTKRFSEMQDSAVKMRVDYDKKGCGLNYLNSAIANILLLLTASGLYLGYRITVTKTLSTGDFVAVFNGIAVISGVVSYLTGYGLTMLTERSKMIEKMRLFLSTEPTVTDGEQTAECGAPETIKAENIVFSYKGSNKNSVDGISFEIKPYEKIALVGYNGAGKTTLTNLLLRLYDVTDGKITVGNDDIRNVTLSSHRERFAAVFQDFKIFSASLGTNVALSREYDEKRVLAALEAAGFDKELPNGLDTVLLREFDENGVMLSGGEQQKIAVARAFYKNCPYIILDEPSANLDPEAEYELNRTITDKAKDKTVIFISHRLSTTRIADRILMLENGKIIESGTHDELMALGGKYAEMFNLQAEKYKTAHAE